MADNFIAGAIKKPGQLHRDLHVPQGEKIPAGKLAAAKGKGRVGERARLAETLGGLNHGANSGSSNSGGEKAHPAERPYLHMIPSRSGK